jgi:hypothetical protein
VYVLGPESVISKAALTQIGRVSASVQRVGATGVVQKALLFARYTDGSFGWNINDPGHGMELANSDRPLDAAAAASLASSGQWGPLLVTDTADALPPELRSFLLDIKPGYATDPTRAVYNYIWLMGDATAIGGQVQAEVDELAELAPTANAPDPLPVASPSRAASRGAEPDAPEGQEVRGGATRPADEAVTVRDIGAGRTVPPALRPPDPQSHRRLIEQLPEDDPVGARARPRTSSTPPRLASGGDPRGRNRRGALMRSSPTASGIKCLPGLPWAVSATWPARRSMRAAASRPEDPETARRA